jgi:hypothetical protein
VQIHANCRIRRIYFSDRLYTEEELPAEFKLFLPISQQQAAEEAARAAAGAPMEGGGGGGEMAAAAPAS